MHDMQLHEVRIQGIYRIIRVPGGWIYERRTWRITEQDNDVEMIFVPYSDEFRAPSS